MVISKRDEQGHVETEQPVYDRLSELKAFDDTKLGVKGVADSGLSKIPRIFHHVPRHDDVIVGKQDSGENQFSIPIIDLKGIHEDSIRRAKVVNEVLDACGSWGFFQVVNHGMPLSLMDEMIDGMKKFHEQDDEVKKSFYSRDFAGRTVLYNSNYDLWTSEAADWRDNFYCDVAPDPPKLDELPAVCSHVIMYYANQVMKLGETLFELLSEALGLNSNHLKGMGCSEGLVLGGNYYPPCPEPELTMAGRSHTDAGLLTILLQDQVGGLQVLHDDEWIDVPYVEGALIINVADLLQLITNDKFRSVHHRVLANNTGPRVSVPCFYRVRPELAAGDGPQRVYGPIDELLSEDYPPVYRTITAGEYFNHYFSKEKGGAPGVLHFRI